jgi:hypothetical protein
MAEQKNIFLPLEEVEGLICETYAEKCIARSKQAFEKVQNKILETIKYKLNDALALKDWNHTGTILIDIDGSISDELAGNIVVILQSPPFGFYRATYQENPNSQFVLQY